MSQNQDYFPKEYSDLYAQIINQNICLYSTDFFTTFNDNKLTCENFVSNSTSYVIDLI